MSAAVVAAAADSAAAGELSAAAWRCPAAWWVRSTAACVPLPEITGRAVVLRQALQQDPTGLEEGKIYHQVDGTGSRLLQTVFGGISSRQ